MNGVLKTQAQYYNDPETYPGEGGTETNKAVIEDIYDLCAWMNVMTNQADVYAVTQHKQYAVLIRDVNFNDHRVYKYGLTTDTLIDMSFGGNKGDLDGAGHSVLNMVINSNTPKTTTHGIIYNGTVHDINFKNIVLMGNRNDANSVHPVFGTVTINSCNMSVYFSTDRWAHLMCKNIYLNDVTINMAGSIEQNVLIAGNYSSSIVANRVKFNFNNLRVMSTTAYNQVAGGGSGLNCTNCAFTGLIYQTNVTSSASHYLCSSYINNCYFAITTGVTNYTSLFNISSSGAQLTGMNVIDKDLLGGEYADGTNYMMLSTAEMKSSSTLLRYGFLTL